MKFFNNEKDGNEHYVISCLARCIERQMGSIRKGLVLGIRFQIILLTKIELLWINSKRIQTLKNEKKYYLKKK